MFYLKGVLFTVLASNASPRNQAQANEHAEGTHYAQKDDHCSLACETTIENLLEQTSALSGRVTI